MLSPQRYACVLLVLLPLLFVAGCSGGAQEYWQAGPYEGTWEYRYGEPLASSVPSDPAAPRWAQPDLPGHPDAGWRPTRRLSAPPDRGNATTLWLRTRLSGPRLAQPTISLATYSEDVEAFLDGRIIFTTHPDGQLSPASALLPQVPLPVDYQGHLFVLRIQGRSRFLGLTEAPMIGHGPAVLAAWLRRGTPPFVMSILLSLMAFGSMVLAALRREERSYLHYGGLCLSAAFLCLTVTRLPSLWVQPQVRWGRLGAMAGLLMSYFLVSYVRLVIGDGPRRILLWLSRYALLFMLVIIPLALVRILPVDRLIALVLLQNFVISVPVAAVVLLSAGRGDIDARILRVGFLMLALVLVMETVSKFSDRVSSSTFYHPYGLGALVLAGGIAQARRFFGVHQRLVRLAVESTLAQQRLSEQGGLLQAAARMAGGNLETPISAPSLADLVPLAAALEQMRMGVAAQLHALHDKNTEVQQLNDELRRQIEHRTDHLIEIISRSRDGKSSRAPALSPGQKLGEHYQVVRLLGQGAMGCVYEVERLTDGTHLAAKLMLEVSSRVAFLRFAREARNLSQLSHPNLIRITDIDIDASGAFYLVMELVAGQTLRQCIERFSDAGFVLSVLRQIAAGLRAIHAAGILHRDLKPANLLVADGSGGGPLVKIADFGLSALLKNQAEKEASPDSEERSVPTVPEGSESGFDSLSATQSGLVATPDPAAAAQGLSMGSLTQTGTLVGTPVYMAPELAADPRGATQAADLFSFGVIAFELLVGKLPFEEPPVVMALRGARFVAPELQALRTDLRSDLARMLQRCLSADPIERPAAAEVEALLSQVQSLRT